MQGQVDEIGQDLQLGGYRVEASLGRGGMGEVFLAWDERLHRHVAIKRIRADLPVEAAQRKRFRREARAVARLSHPAIVQVFDLIESEVSDCLVMERIEGRSLTEVIARGEVDLEVALRLASEIADGLAEAHGQGLVHRDLKPDNVLVTRSGHAKILDFGLARMLWDDAQEDDSKPSSGGLTQAGTLVGTVHAMSPEQASGRAVDHRSDLFALGSMLYEMLTRRAPFRGENWLDSLRKVTGERPEPLALLRPDLPSDLVLLVESLLEKEPDRRPANARMVADRLEQLRRLPLDAPAPAIEPAGPSLPGSGSNRSRSDLAEQPTGEWPQVAEAADDSQGYVEKVVRALLRTEPVGRKKLLKRHGESSVAEALSRHDRKLRQLVARHGGVEVEKGDAFLAIFERPADAVACALSHHRALAELSGALGWKLEARTAIHLGDILLRHNAEEEISRGARPLEVEGTSKTTAGHLGDLARPGQTLLTRAAFDLARRALGEESRDGEAMSGQGPRWLAHGSYFFTDVDEPVELFEVGVEGLAPLEAPDDSEHARRILSPSEERMLGWRPAVGQEIPLRENWTLTERLGEGGFGEVWLAKHRSGERRVFKFCFEAARLRALKREVTLFRLLKETLGHRDDIARILDWHFDEAPFFVESEYTEGGSLPAWAEEQGGLDRVPLETRLELAAEVADALAAAHSVGVLHKDVKPENVLITTDRDGKPHARLTDFGIGLLTERERLDEPGFSALGFTATVSPTESAGGGTLGYLAPELMAGKPATVQADVYSLGVLLYQLVVGDTSRALAPGWERDIQDPILTEDLSELVDGNPDRRPASCREVADRLRRIESRRAERRAVVQAQEQAERATKRKRLLSIVAVTSTFFSIVVAITALQAIHARKEADQRRVQAEKLVDFMLFDLRKSLENVGRLDLLGEVANEAQRYLEEQPFDRETPKVQHQRAASLVNTADVLMDQGRPTRALAGYQEARRALEGLISGPEPQADWYRELAICTSRLAKALHQMGDTAGALETFEIATREIELAAKVLHESGISDNTELALAKVSIRLSFGQLLALQRAHGLARQQLKTALAIANSTLVPPESSWRFSEKATEVRIELGKLHLFNSEFEAALTVLDEAMSALNPLLDADPENLIGRALTARVQSDRGRTLLVMGQFDAAADAYAAASRILSGLIDVDPSNVEWRLQLVEASTWRGRSNSLAGHNSQAMVYYNSASETLTMLSGLDSSINGVQQRQATLLCLTGDLKLRVGAFEEARDLYQRWLSLSEAGLKRDPGDQEWRFLLGTSLLRIGLAMDALGHHDLARLHWERSVKVLDPISGPEFGDRERLAKSWALLALGKRDQAQRILSEVSYENLAILEPEFEKLLMLNGIPPTGS